MTPFISHFSTLPSQLEKLRKAASAAHTFFVANPSHLEMRNNIEKYRRMEGVTEDAFQDRELEAEKHWVRGERLVTQNQKEGDGDEGKEGENFKIGPLGVSLT